jgi:hypothetical protein
MKIARILIGALAIALSVAACNSQPTGPNAPFDPVIGSGVGT